MPDRDHDCDTGEPLNVCGGCRGEGAHKRHCPRSPTFNFRLMLADAAEDVADRIGPNNFAAANHCYAAAGLLRAEARG